MHLTQSSIQQIFDELLQQACEQKIPDVHFMPTKASYDVLFRQHQQLVKVQELSFDQVERLVTYMKYLANLNIAEKRKPQSGAFYKDVDGANYHFRLSTLPSILNKESIVLRIHSPHVALSLSELAYFPSVTMQLEQLLHEKQGIVFVTGATGSGKTTTLYACLQHVTQQLHKHVITLEDPVEVVYEQALQVQVNEQAGMSYANGLRAILRHTPDVIFVGEIRDAATAEIAIRAALTGHLVLSTIHAKDTIGCIYRLMDFGISLEDIRQTLRAIIAQTLVDVHEDGEKTQKALYEILTQHDLVEALAHVAAKKSYALPMKKQLHYQKEVVMKLEYSTTTAFAKKA